MTRNVSKNVNPEDARQVDLFRKAINSVIGTPEFRELPRNHTFELLSRSIVAFILMSHKKKETNLVTKIGFGVLLGYIFGRRSAFEEMKHEREYVQSEPDSEPPAGVGTV